MRRVILHLAIFSVIFVVVGCVGGWLFIYLKGPQFSPSKQQVIGNARPFIKVSWPWAYGATLTHAEVYLDGKQITKALTLSQRGFSYKPKKDLDDGAHQVEARLEYFFFIPKKLRLKWRFSTDTIPPQIDLENGDFNEIATPNDFLDIKGVTEPLSELKATLNGKSIFASQAGEEGTFSITLKGLEAKNKMVLEAIDRAGNKSHVKMPVVIDKLMPSVLSFTPAPKSKVYGSDVVFNIKLKEKETEIAHAYIGLDNKPVESMFDRKTNTLYGQAQVNADGKHEAVLRVIDIAGNENNKRWQFSADTTKIVISRSEAKLYLYKKGKLFKKWSVAVGQPAYPTPLGHWKIEGKDVMPAWYNPRSGWAASMPPYIAPGYYNPLGVRAMYLNATGVAIHGTAKVGSIGSWASHGCIRVANEEIVDLYPLVPIGCPVDVME
ncbi:MAG: L,D-transpeptidase [Actinobacteria bacterium]|nr:MAG: L,D-transpeptidase [Actinomycetota bacterium]